MKQKAKSLLTILLTALMIMTMLPTTAFAASSKVPAKVSITKTTASTNAVTIQWKKASNATSYRIYYKQSGAKKWIAVANTSKTSYTHKTSKKTPLVGGKKYLYTVRAYNKSSKKWGSYSSSKTVTIPAVPATVKLGSVKGTAYNKVSISWSKASNATSYRIYYKKSGASKWTAVADVTGTSYTHTSNKKAPLTAGSKYIYTVRAYNKNSKKWGGYNTKGISVTVPKKSSTPAKVLVQSVDIDNITTGIDTKGGTYQFTSRVLPANATNKTLKWTSSNTKIATVDQNGKVTGLSEGTVTITATATDGSGKKDSAPLIINFHVDHTKIPATGIKISKTNVELSNWNDSTTIEATLTPSNTTDWVEWKSSNSNVAFVNGGEIVAQYPGTATITAYVANNPSISATCTVVVDYIQYVEIPDSESDITLTSKGATYQINPTIKPANTKHNALKWESDDTSVATVDQNGKVTAVGNGHTTIRVTATDVKYPGNPDLTDACTITVKIPEAAETPTPEPDYYRIIFAKNDGTGSIFSLAFKPGTNYSTSEETETRDGYEFAGWYTEPEGGELVTSVTLQKDTILYAHWTKNETGIKGSNLYLEGSETYSCYIAPEDVASNINISQIEWVTQGNSDTISISGKGYDSRTGCSDIAFRAVRKGQVIILAKYNGQILRRWTVNITSDWEDYVGYVNWRKNVENQIWNNNMSVSQKLDAAKGYIKANFAYKLGSDAAVYAYKGNVADCITASEFMGDFAKDIGCTVRYYNQNTGKHYEYIVEAYSASGGHIFCHILLNDQWVIYDASNL